MSVTPERLGQQELESYLWGAANLLVAVILLTAKGEQKLRSLSRIHLDELSAAAPALAKILRSFRAKVR